MVINIPVVLSFGDYHEIAYTRDILLDFIPGIKCKELGLLTKRSGTGKYVGLFYINKLPDKDLIVCLLKEKFDLTAKHAKFLARGKSLYPEDFGNL